MNKKRKIILATIGIGIIVLASVIPNVLVNKNEQEKTNKDKEDTEAVAKILNEKTSEERIIKLASDSSGKIIGNNKEKIIAEIKKLITDSKLRGVTIEVSIENDVDISTNAIPIIVTLKKGETSIIVKDNKGLKVKRNSTDIELIAKVKAILDGKKLKKITISHSKNSKINTNSQIIEKIKIALEEKVGTNNLYGVIITPEKDAKNGTITNLGGGISFIINLSKGSASSRITNWKVKREWKDEQIVDDYIKKLNLMSLKEVTISQTSGNVTTNKEHIKDKIEKLSDYPLLPQDVSLKVKDDTTTLTTSGVKIILIVKKGNIQKEITGFIVKRKESNQEKANKDIESIKSILDAKFGEDLTITLPSSTTGNVANNKEAIEQELRKLIDPTNNPAGNDNHESLLGTTIKVLASSDGEISPTSQDIIVTISKTDGTPQQTSKTFQVKREKTSEEKETDSINNVAQILNQKPQNEKIVTIINLQAKVGDSGVANKIKAKVEEKIGSGNLEGVQVSISADDTDEDILDIGEGVGFKITLSKGSGQSIEITDWKVKREKTSAEKTSDANSDINSVKTKLNEKTGNELIIILPNNTTGNVANNKGVIEQELRRLIDPTNTTGNANHESLLGTTISVLASSDGEISPTSQDIIVKISKTDGTPQQTSKTFQVKREKTSEEKESDAINNVAQILNQKPQNEKIVTIINLQTKVGDSLVANKIKAKVEEKIGSGNLEGVQVSISADDNDEDILDIGEGVGFKITLSKGSGQSLEITDWKVKREKTSAEKTSEANVAINSIKEKLDEKTGEDLTITLPNNTTGNVVDNKREIEQELRKLIDPTNNPVGDANHESLLGTTISVLASPDGEISPTSQDIIVTISKTDGTPQQTSKTFQVKREKTSEEKETDSINNVAQILNQKPQNEKIVTIINLQAKVGDSLVANKIKAKVEEKIGSGNLEGVQVSISADDNDEDILDIGEGIGFKITLSKGSGQSLEITDWKVKREKTSAEKTSEANVAINSIKEKLDEKTGEDLTITLPNNTTGNVVDNKREIEQELRKLIDPTNNPAGDANHESLLGTTISVLASPDGEISPTSQDIIVTISKTDGTPQQTSKTFQVKREKTSEEKETDSINNVAQILNQKPQNEKIVTIINLQAKVGDSLVANKIKAKVEEKIGSGNLEGVQVSISADDNDEDILDIGEGIGFKITLSKGSGQSLEITDWKVKREKTSVEKTSEANVAINSIKEKLDEKTGEDLTITLPNNTTGNVVDNKREIEQELRKLIDPINNPTGNDNHESLLGTTISVLASSNGEISPTSQDIIVTISKTDGTPQQTSKTFQVKREKTNSEKANDAIGSIKEKLDEKTGEDLTITLPNNTTGNVADNKAAIEQELRKLIDPTNNPIGNANHESLLGTTISVLASSDGEISPTSQDIIVTISKTDGTSQRTTKIFQVKREKTNFEKTNDAIDFIKEKLDEKTGEDLIIILPRNTTGNVADNKAAIEKELRKLIDPTNNPTGNANHESLLGTKIEVLAIPDDEISPTSQNIIVTISKADGNSKRTTTIFQVKREKTNFEKANDAIYSIKEKLDAKTGKDLIIILPRNTIGNVADNKAAIEKELRKLIDPINNFTGNVNHKSLLGTIIEVSKILDDEISPTSQNIIVTVSKTNGLPEQTTKIFKVKRQQTEQEKAIIDANFIKEKLEKIPKEQKIITLPSSTIGNPIDNKGAIEAELRKLIDPKNNPTGNAKHKSLLGTKIKISESSNNDITTVSQYITVIVEKTFDVAYGVAHRITNKFQVKREENKQEKANKDIEFVKSILDAKVGEDLIITLLSSTTGNIIANNQEAIITKLKELIGANNLKGTTISVSMTIDALISTTAQNIIVTISKTDGDDQSITNKFQVKREENKQEKANKDIEFVKSILDAKVGEDLIITLLSSTTGNIIANNQEAIITKLKELIGANNLKGTTISVSMTIDALISTTAQNIIVTISKTDGDDQSITNKFQVKKEQTNQEKANKDIEFVKSILDAKLGEDLIITLLSSTKGNIIANNQEAIITKLKELIGANNLKGTTISVSMIIDALISTTAQNIIVTISKTDGDDQSITNKFQVKREETNQEKANKDIEFVKSILDAKVGEDLIITLLSSTKGNIIANNQEAIITKLKELIGANNLKGTTISVSMTTDVLILTTAQNIIVTISKTDGDDQSITNKFQVQRSKTIAEINNDKIDKIKAKITDVNLTIDKNVKTSNDSEILIAIKNQLQIDNPTLTSQNLEKITDNISSLTPGKSTNVILKITIGSESNTIFITVIRPLSDQELVKNLKDNIEKISSKEVTINQTSGTIIENKDSIKAKVIALPNFPELPSGVTLEVKEEATTLTTSGVPITLVVKKGEDAKIEIIGFIAKRSESNQESVDSYVAKLNELEIKEVTISETLGTIKDNKDSIRTQILNIPNFPKLPEGINLEVKEDTTLLTIDGVSITLIVKKDQATKEVTDFIVKKSKHFVEKDIDSIKRIEKILKQKNQKVILIIHPNEKISQSNGADKIKNKLIEQIGENNLNGAIIKVKEKRGKDTNIPIEGEGLEFDIELWKGNVAITVHDWKVKREWNEQHKVVEDYIKKLYSIENELIIKFIGKASITEKKNEIISAIKSLTNFPKLHSDITLNVEASSKYISLEETPITLIITRGTITRKLRRFVVKKVLIGQEDVDEYKTKLLNSIKLENRNILLDNLDINNAASRTITNEKSNIINKFEKLKGFVNKPDGVSLDVKEDETKITIEGVPISIVIKKGEGEAIIESNIVSPFKVSRNAINFIENLLLSYYKSFGYKIEIPNDISTNDYNEIKKAIIDQLIKEVPNFNIIKGGIKIPSKVTSISQDKNNPTIINIEFAHEPAKISKIVEFKVWKTTTL